MRVNMNEFCSKQIFSARFQIPQKYHDFKAQNVPQLPSFKMHCIYRISVIFNCEDNGEDDETGSRGSAGSHDETKNHA